LAHPRGDQGWKETETGGQAKEAHKILVLKFEPPVVPLKQRCLQLKPCGVDMYHLNSDLQAKQVNC
jgi:hypothetical protein